MINKKIIISIGIISFFITIILLFITIKMDDADVCKWSYTDWSTCTKEGNQTRAVSCKNKEGGYCTSCTEETKPIDSQNCIYCKVAKKMDFPDIPSKACVFPNKNNTTAYKPAYTIFLRHCDRGYSDEPHYPNPPTGYPERTTCKTDDSNICEGCVYLEAEGGCASNDCSTKGINRSWALGKWINCFANDKEKEIAGIIAQKFIPSKSNQRPTTTATIIYESLNVNFLKLPCYMYAEKGDYKTVKSYLEQEIFNNKIVVIVWSHGQLKELIKSVTNLTGTEWESCCFDKVAVMDYNANKIKVYNTKSLEENDLCGGKVGCNVTDTYETCSFSNFGNQTPCLNIS